jgi:hypothetical protein
MRRVFLLFLLIVSTAAWAAPPQPQREEEFTDVGLTAPAQSKPAASPDRAETRNSSLSLDAAGGKDRYLSSTLSGSFSTGDSGAIKAELGFSKSGDDKALSEGKVGFAGDATEDLSLRLDVEGREEPNSVHGRGLSAGLEWDVASLWDADLSTVLSVTVEIVRYTQSDEATGSRLPGAIPQRSVGIGLTQDLLENFHLGVSGQSYSYSTDPKVLSDAVELRLASYPGFSGLVSGFPKNSFSLSLGWEPLDRWSFYVSASSTLNAVDATREKSLELRLGYELSRAWSCTLTGSGSQTEDQKNPGMLGLGFSYRW